MNTALKNIRRTPFQALAAIFVVSITLFVVGIFTLVTLASHSILLNFETKPQIIAYLKDGREEERPLGWLLNRHQRFNLEILTDFLMRNKDRMPPADKLRTELIGHGWDIAIVDSVIKKVYSA